jgi:hypothetical protein
MDYKGILPLAAFRRRCRLTCSIHWHQGLYAFSGTRDSIRGRYLLGWKSPQEMTAKAIRQGSHWLEPGRPVRAAALAGNGANRIGAAMKEEPPKQLRVRTVGTKLTDREYEQ